MPGFFPIGGDAVGGSGGLPLTIADVGRADETDAALALAQTQAIAVGRADEADAAFSPGIAVPAGMAGETDTALPPGVATAAGIAAETDTALDLQPASSILSEESDFALALAVVQIHGAGLSEEISASLALAVVQRRAAGMTTETDTAFALIAAVTVVTPAARRLIFAPSRAAQRTVTLE